MAESMVVRIAEAYGLVVVTQNIKHFRPFGISALSPNKAARE
jgi:predicted nucleic acid-binding protein